LLEHFSLGLFDHPVYSLNLATSNHHCLPTWRTNWDRRASTVMKSWWNASKCGWAQRRRTTLTQAYKSLFLNVTGSSIVMVTTLKFVFFCV
jgi:hypothetical protein